ncbi:MAG: hydroxyethylthiazole kinase [Solibacillus sp.]
MSLQQITKRKPLVHCITNYVVANFTANGLLAVGASPVMADAKEEAVQMASIADALLLNIGTLNTETVVAMKLAGAAANAKGIPVVLDPVGVGATGYRLQTAKQLLEELDVQLIRCNAGELAALAGVAWQAKGVDCGEGQLPVAEAAKALANNYACLVIVTGEVDCVTDGEQVAYVAGGNARITQITGTGCLLSALCAAVLSASEDAFRSLTALLQEYKDIAARTVGPVGSYQTALLNALEQVAEVAK